MQTQTIVVKVRLGDDLRRLSVESPAGKNSFQILKGKISEYFPQVHGKTFSLKFEDDEKELCTISSDFELAEAVALTVREQLKSLRLWIYDVQDLPSAPGTPQPAPTQPQATKPQEKTQTPKPQETQIPKQEAQIPKQEAQPASDEAEDKEFNLIVLNLLIDFLETPEAAAAIPEMIQVAVRTLPTVTDRDQAVAFIERLLDVSPVVRNHPLAQVVLAQKYDSFLIKLPQLAQRVGPMAGFAQMMLPQLLNQLPQVMATLPGLLAERLAAMQDQDEDTPDLSQVFRQMGPQLLPQFLGGSPFMQQGSSQQGSQQGFPFQPMQGQGQNGMQTPPFLQAMQAFAAQNTQTGFPQGQNGVSPFLQALSAFGSQTQAQNGVTPFFQGFNQAAAAATPVVTTSCSFCHSAIDGVHFTCTVCPNFALCEECEGSHEPSHSRIKVRAKTPETKHSEPLPCPKCTSALSQHTTPHVGYSCDVCQTRMLAGAAMLGCRRCDWDVCLPCHVAGAPVEAPTVRQVTSPTAPIQDPAPEPAEPAQEKPAEPAEPNEETPLEEKPAEKPAEEEKDPDMDRFAAQLQTLAEMDFSDVKLNLYLLNRFDGSLVKVLNLYLNNGE